MTTHYVAVDIGCIECGEESMVLGIFTDKDTAEATINTHAEWQGRHWCGEHNFKIFTIRELNKALPLPLEETT